MSILGHYNNFFFAAHLLDIAMGVKTLRTILSSVTHNGKQVCVPTQKSMNGFKKKKKESPSGTNEAGPCSWWWRWACWLWWCTCTRWWPSTSSASSTTRARMRTNRTWSATTWWLLVIVGGVHPVSWLEGQFLRLFSPHPAVLPLPHVRWRARGWWHRRWDWRPSGGWVRTLSGRLWHHLLLLCHCHPTSYHPRHGFIYFDVLFCWKFPECLIWHLRSWMFSVCQV